MFEPIGEDSEGERLGLRDRFVASGAVREDTRQISYFADPSAVVFALDLNRKVAHLAHRTTWAARREIRLSNGPHVQPRGRFLDFSSATLSVALLEARKRRATSGPRQLLRGVGRPLLALRCELAKSLKRHAAQTADPIF